MAKAKDSKKPEPAFQPSNVDNNTNKFGSSEIWWWDNGIWGECGYAIPNDGGKPTTGNEVMQRIVEFIGSELFNLMHRPDVKFNRPFNLKWLRDFNKMLVLGHKRLGDYSVGFTDERTGDAAHAVNTPQAFTFFPVPFFGQRIRQADARKWCGELLLLQSEMIQHSDNDFDADVTDFSVGFAQRKLERIQHDMAMKYLGFSREQVEAEGFVLPETALSEQNYNPADLFTDNEMTQERMPELWWPQANDLTPINGLSSIDCNVFARQWPITSRVGDGGASEAAFPGGGGARRVIKPGS